MQRLGATERIWFEIKKHAAFIDSPFLWPVDPISRHPRNHVTIRIGSRDEGDRISPVTVRFLVLLLIIWIESHELGGARPSDPSLFFSSSDHWDWVAWWRGAGRSPLSLSFSSTPSWIGLSVVGIGSCLRWPIEIGESGVSWLSWTRFRIARESRGERRLERKVIAVIWNCVVRCGQRKRS